MLALETLLGAAIITYLVVIGGLAILAKGKVKNESDFLVAGRRLSTFFASATLFATWFGAGTLLTATDAIYRDGFFITALEPFGAGACLFLAGLFFAKPLWKLKIFTIPDLFLLKFGPRAEKVSAILLVPSYFGWIAVQITALSGIVNLFFGIPLAVGMIAVTVLAAILTFLGGMWSVTLTDSAQMVFVGLVLCILAYLVLLKLGNGRVLNGIEGLIAIGSKEQANNLGSESGLRSLFAYLNTFAVAALGNLPGQDLAQRIFSANSGQTARRSCLIAGGFYIGLGSISILLGIASRTLLPEGVTHSIIPHLAQAMLSPWFTTILMLAIFSVIMSTMDSAMLATASIISHNLLKKYSVKKGLSSVFLCRICVGFVGLASLILAFLGENAYSLLEQSYAISLVGLFAPFFLAIVIRRGNEAAAIASMLLGISVWGLGFIFESLLALELIALLISFLAYGCFSLWLPGVERADDLIIEA